MNTGRLWAFLASGILVLAIACSRTDSQEQPQVPESSSRVPLEAAKATATINGRVRFSGTAAQPSPIDMKTDPSCAAVQREPQFTEDLVVTDGNLQNVFVWVKEGLEKYSFEPPAEPVTIEQAGCRYKPHVGGIMVNQKLRILNSDPTLHNIHCVADRNAQFNIGQPVQGMTSERVFSSPEVMVRFKCDVHKWMTSYFGVVPHPYFGVTGRDGTFALKNLPPGDYVIEAWHEKFGTRTQRVKLGERETREVDFSFSPSL